MQLELFARSSVQVDTTLHQKHRRVALAGEFHSPGFDARKLGRAISLAIGCEAVFDDSVASAVGTNNDFGNRVFTLTRYSVIRVWHITPQTLV